MAQKQVKSQDDNIQEQLALFHSQEALSLNAKFRHIENLVGKKHHFPTEGYHCEVLLKEYLRANLPSRFSVDTGFIRAEPVEFDGKKLYASPQIDILIHDCQHHSPLYRIGDLVVVQPEAVVAIIEVKKTLTSTELQDALYKLAVSHILLQQRTYDPSVIYSGVFSYDTRLPVKSEAFKNRLQELIARGGILPNSIVCLKGLFIKIVSKKNKYNEYDISNITYLLP